MLIFILFPFLTFYLHYPWSVFYYSNLLKNENRADGPKLLLIHMKKLIYSLRNHHKVVYDIQAYAGGNILKYNLFFT